MKRLIDWLRQEDPPPEQLREIREFWESLLEEPEDPDDYIPSLEQIARKLGEGEFPRADHLAARLRDHQGPIPPGLRRYIADVIDNKVKRQGRRLGRREKKIGFWIRWFQMEFTEAEEPRPYDAAVEMVAQGTGLPATTIEKWARPWAAGFRYYRPRRKKRR